jgi:hypothetical protein
METIELEKATLTYLATRDRVRVLWNPERYAIRRSTRVASVDVIGRSLSAMQTSCGGVEEFSTDLLLDASRQIAEAPDLHAIADQIRSWMDPPVGASLPGDVLFAWGEFRFRGVLTALDQLWVRFRADGRPLRGWLRLVIRR